MVVSENIDVCKHEKQITDYVRGDVICEDCGLVLERCFVDSSYKMNEFDKNNRKTFFPQQYVGLSDGISFVGGVGSFIDFFKSRYLFDVNGNVLSPKKQLLYRKLKKYNFNEKIRIKQTIYRTLKYFNQVSAILKLPFYIKNRVYYFYRKIRRRIKKSEYLSNIILIAACLYVVIREFSFPLSIKVIIKTFCDLNCKVSLRSVLRVVMVIKSNFFNFFLKNHHLRSEDYVILMVNQIKNFIVVKERLFQCGKTVVEFKQKLLKYSYEILSKISDEKRIGQNPLLFTIAVIYASSLIIRSDWNSECYILTQSILSQIFDFSEYSIRYKWRFIRDCLNME